MNAVAIDDLKARLRATWSAGDYDVFARPMEDGAVEYFQTLPLERGMKMLDVGCGAGQLALIASRAGLDVTGCDIAVNWLERARARAADEGLTARFEEGDAEQLPYADASFDVVTSMYGAMFAPRPDLVAAELRRVVKPGGLIAMANWTPGGFIGQMFRTIAAYIAPPGMPSPVLWGDEQTVRERFGDGVAELEMTKRMFPFRYPFPPADVVEFFRQNYGPSRRTFDSLDTAAASRLRRELTELWSVHNSSAGGETHVQAEYLDVRVRRAES